MVRTYAVHAGPYVPDVDDVPHVPDVPIWHDVPAVPVVSAVHVVHAVPQPPQRKIRMMLTWARLIFFCCKHVHDQRDQESESASVRTLSCRNMRSAT